MTEVTIHKCSRCGSYREIFIKKDGYKQRLFEDGDEYHKDISVVEKTLLETMSWFDIEYTKTEILIKCKFHCDND